jgi:hypothetical protein
MQPEPEKWYRYEDVRYASSLDEFDNPIGEGRLEVKLREFAVFKHTPKGVWIGWSGPEKFVLRESRKRYACPTIEEAKESFIARKKRQAGIYRARLRDAEKALAIIQGKVLA